MFLSEAQKLPRCASTLKVQKLVVQPKFQYHGVANLYPHNLKSYIILHD